MTIVAIGGGEIENGGTLPVDEEIVESSDSEDARVLFIPTASEDSEEYIQKFRGIYRNELGCETDTLLLVEENLDKEKIKSKIQDADVVYVGGGNTRKMVSIWSNNNVDELLEEEYRNGTVMSGLSAGGICWFEHGHSDSESYETEDEDWDFIRVDGLDLIHDIIFCTHYHEEDREESFKKMTENNPDKTGLAVDNEAAVKIEDGSLELIKSDESGKAYIIRNGNLKKELKKAKTYSLENLKS